MPKGGNRISPDATLSGYLPSFWLLCVPATDLCPSRESIFTSFHWLVRARRGLSRTWTARRPEWTVKQSAFCLIRGLEPSPVAGTLPWEGGRANETKWLTDAPPRSDRRRQKVGEAEHGAFPVAADQTFLVQAPSQADATLRRWNLEGACDERKGRKAEDMAAGRDPTTRMQE